MIKSKFTLSNNSMKNLITLVLINLIVSGAIAQTYIPRQVCTLPAFLSESSGIVVDDPNNFWTHNDSGSGNELYQVDSSGVLLRSIVIRNAFNADWEDMCKDVNGNMYIGDFGNNLNNRQDLKIYKIGNPNLSTSDSVDAVAINFSFPDQSQFPPPASGQNFDCEAVFHTGDSLYIFSKNRGTSKFCKMYRLPDDSGTYVATLVDSFDTSLWITSADISPNKNWMTLLSESRIHVFTGFTGNSFFNGQYIPINIVLTQKEAIAFIDNDKVYMTDEKIFTIGGKLYELDIEAIINSVISANTDNINATLYPNPVTNILRLLINDAQSENLIGRIFDVDGRLIRSVEIDFLPPTSITEFDISDLASGIYHLQILGKNSSTSLKFVMF